MEPLRVLELYSGIGGMHQALRGGSAQSASLDSRVGAGPRSGARQGRSGHTLGRRPGEGGNSVVLETAGAATSSRRSGRRLPSSRLPRCPDAGCRPLEVSVCESRSARLGCQMGGASPLPGRCQSASLLLVTRRRGGSGLPSGGRRGEGRSLRKSGRVTDGSSRRLSEH